MMLRIGLFALMAIGLLGFGAAVWVSTLPPTAPEPVVAEAAPPPAPTPPPPPAKMTVTVAAHTLRAGSFLRPEDLRSAEMDSDHLPPGALTDSPAVRGQLNGSMLRRGVGEGEPLAAADVLKMTDHGFLAAVLEPGMRAVTVPLTGLDAGAGFLWPGDRIDLILTINLTDADIRARRRYAGETVMQDIRVVAVDTQLVPGEAPDDAKTPDETTKGHKIAVEVTPEAAEQLAVALRLGSIGVALRPVHDDAPTGRGQDRKPVLQPVLWEQAPEEAPRRVTWSGDVSRALNLPVRSPPPPTVQVFRGSAAGGRN